MPESGQCELIILIPETTLPGNLFAGSDQDGNDALPLLETLPSAGIIAILILRSMKRGIFLPWLQSIDMNRPCACCYLKGPIRDALLLPMHKQ